ncbi:hypothetical protein B0T25DRAFT_532111, partial [Lasiosphaeria hispida]
MRATLTIVNKNRVSGFWGGSTPVVEFLREEGITTLLFTGVNTDQCVFSSRMLAAWDSIPCCCVVAAEPAAPITQHNWYCTTVKGLGGLFRAAKPWLRESSLWH